MKKICWTLSFVGLLSVAASAQVTKEEVRRFVEAGLPEDVVLAFIRAHGPALRLTADDLVELKAAGATDRVLAALIPESSSGTSFPVLYDRVSRCWIDLNCRRVAPALATWGQTYSNALPVCPPPLPICHPRCVPSIRLHCFRR